MPTVLDIDTFLNAESKASYIANLWDKWDGFRGGWLEDRQELDRFLYATSTKTTTNNQTPWKNSTTTPKLTQLLDNLQANYMAALFPGEDWLFWEGQDEVSASKEKRQVILSYIKNKTRQSKFRTTVSSLVYDYVSAGNAFCIVEYEKNIKKDPATGEDIPGYVGPRARRISPYDIVFDPTAISFSKSPKIIRSLKSIGELLKESKNPGQAYKADVLDKIKENRRQLATFTEGDNIKNGQFSVDGFSNFTDYFSSGYVEILEFYGDIYNQETGEFDEDQIITVVDRSYILREVSNPSWHGKAPIHHVGWRLRPDNLWAMGPLDNLVGMQYRIDHLENLKADVWDMIAFPVLKIRGEVEDFEYAPGERIYVGDDGDVEFMHPDATALNADLQIDVLQARMEELAGAPKQAMGIRTPGEKTKYEVQSLENASGRIFQNKVTYFEEGFLEPILNDMLEQARRSLDVDDMIRVIDNDLGIEDFAAITKEDITASGKLYPMGARHFATLAKLVQDLTAFSNSPIGQDPSVNVHLSGKKLAQLFEELLGIKKFGLYQENVRIFEQMETQQLAQTAGEQMEADAMTPSEVQEGDVIEEEPVVE